METQTDKYMLKVYHCVIFSATRDKHGGDTHLNSISVESLYHTDKSKGLNLYLKKYEYISVQNTILNFLSFFFRFAISHRNNMTVLINHDVVFGSSLFTIPVLLNQTHKHIFEKEKQKSK